MYGCVLPLNQYYYVQKIDHDMPFVLKLYLFSLTSAQTLLSVSFVIFNEMAIKSNSLRCAILLHLHATPLA